VTKIGGISEMRKIAALAEAFGVRLVPHCAYFGPGYLASLHLVASLASAAWLERLYLRLEANPFASFLDPNAGRIAIPTGPGLGCDPDMAIVERYRTDPITIIK
jgi:L-alanine-DL-glutamate epimerase-like enolase superfamily enzyme